METEDAQNKQGADSPLFYLNPKSSPVAHLTVHGNRVFLAKKLENYWQGITRNGEIISGEEANLLNPDSGVRYWSSVSCAKRQLREEFGVDMGFMVARENRFRTETYRLPVRRQPHS